MSSFSSNEVPAICGGTPVVPGGPPDWPPFNEEVAAVLRSLVESGDWGRYHAGHTERLEAALAESHQCRHVVLVSSGTAAVELALRALGVKTEAEVILSAYDFKANFTNINLLGAKPVLVDVDLVTGQIDVEQIEQAITTCTRAIVVSHLHGSVVEMPRLRELADRRGIPILEDACQMTGGVVANRVAGTWGDVGVLSFGGSKLVTAGRGGALITNRDDIAQRVRLYQQRGNLAYPLSEMQAAVLLPQWNSLPKYRAIRTEAVNAIHRGISESVRAGLVPFMLSVAESEPDFYKVGFRFSSSHFAGLSRERFCQAMRAEGIAIDPGFRALHRIHARSRYRTAGELQAAEVFDESVVVIHHPLLLNGKDAAPPFLQALDRIREHATILKSRWPEFAPSQSN